MSIKLNLGSGHTPLEGYEPIDRILGKEVYPLPDYQTGTVDEVRASHVLEHFGHKLTKDVLKEWVRVLKPGGLLKIAVPDFEYALAHAGHPHFEGWIFGGQIDENDYHEAMFTRGKLKILLEAVGLQNITEWKSDIKDCASMSVSLNLMGSKPLATPENQPKIACALSIPRLGFNDNWGCISAALMPWRIPIRRYTGVWWERSLQNVLEDMIAEGVDLAVTVDYDSMFTAPQFNSLLDYIISHPEVDAACAIQAQRGSGATMCTPTHRTEGSDTVTVKTDQPLQVDTGHFGLTIIRLEKLKGMRRPWFLNVPGESGSWRREAKGLIDADIYFWNQWKAAGRNLFMLPWVSIGHLECLVSKIDPATGENVHTYPADWVQKNFGGVKVKREVPSESR